MIDWTKPIEAVHEDGRVVPVERMGGYGDHCVCPTLDGGWFAFNQDGTHLLDQCLWRIRNVTSPEVSDTSGQLPAAFVERMVAILRKCTSYHGSGYIGIHGYTASALCEEASAIVAELPKPVDADFDAALVVYSDVGEGQAYPGYLEALCAAIKRGRELEREGK